MTDLGSSSEGILRARTLRKGFELQAKKRPNLQLSSRSLEGNIVPLIVKPSLEGNIVPLIVKPSPEGNIVPLIVKPRKFTGTDRRDLESSPTTKYP